MERGHDWGREAAVAEVRADVRHFASDMAELRQDLRHLDARLFHMLVLEIATLATLVPSLVMTLVTALG